MKQNCLSGNINFRIAKYLFLVIISGVCSINSIIGQESIGYQYHTRYLKAKYFMHWNENRNIDSTIYYYDQALSTGIYFEYHHFPVLIELLLFKRLEKCREYIKMGIKHGLTWKEIQLGIHYSRKLLSLPANSHLYAHRERIQPQDLISTKEYRDISGKNHMNRHISCPWARKQIQKALRLDQQGGRKFHSLKNARKTEKNDSLVYQMIYSVIDSLGRVPTVQDVGEDAYDEISLFIIHMDADRLITLLPYFVKAINEGSYHDNEGVAYALERTGLVTGKYIICEKDSFTIFTDTVTQINRTPVYSYLGAMPYPIDTNTYRVPGKRLFVRPVHPMIGKNRVDQMLSLLCLQPLPVFLEKNKIAVIDHEGNMIDPDSP